MDALFIIGKKDISRDQRIWNASPIVFFQNDLSLKSASTVNNFLNNIHLPY